MCWLFRACSATCKHNTHTRTHGWWLTAAIRCVCVCMCVREYVWVFVNQIRRKTIVHKLIYVCIYLEYSLALSRIEKCVFCTFLRHSVIHFELYCGSELMRFIDPFSVRWNWMSLIFSLSIQKGKRSEINSTTAKQEGKNSVHACVHLF